MLDCGCGAGRFVALATKRGAAVAGIDASGELAAIAAKRTPGADIRVGDVEALPWPDSDAAAEQTITMYKKLYK